MEKVILKADKRDGTGKKIAKQLRSKGVIPANVYKNGKGAQSIQLGEVELTNILHTKAGENVIITLSIAGVKDNERTVVIKEIQRDAIKDRVLHVDFNEISLTEELRVDVPIIAKGEPVGVKAEGGILEHILWELEIECLPTAIPEKIEVDVSALKVGDSVFVKDISMAAGVKVLNDPELTVVIVKPPKVEVVAAEVEEEAGTEPELIRKKKEEEAEEGAEAAKEAPKEAKEAKEKK